MNDDTPIWPNDGYSTGQGQPCQTCNYYRDQYENMAKLCGQMERELEEYDVIKQGKGKVVKLYPEPMTHHNRSGEGK